MEDAACPIGEVAGQKNTSTAFYPPEMARYELQKAADIRPTATEAFEMWYFGLLGKEAFEMWSFGLENLVQPTHPFFALTVG